MLFRGFAGVSSEMDSGSCRDHLINKNLEKLSGMTGSESFSIAPQQSNPLAPETVQGLCGRR
jgi:hypothetical protein